MTLSAGQDKTILCILTAILLHKKFIEAFNKIMVDTISNPMKMQLDSNILNHLIEVKIKST